MSCGFGVRSAGRRNAKGITGSVKGIWEVGINPETTLGSPHKSVSSPCFFFFTHLFLWNDWKKCQPHPNEHFFIRYMCFFENGFSGVIYVSHWFVDVPEESWRLNPMDFENPINTPASYRCRAYLGGFQLILRVPTSPTLQKSHTYCWLLMVQKSQGQIAGMVLKPCK